MPAIDWALIKEIAVIRLGDGENRLNPVFIEGFLKALDQVEAEMEAKGLVVTSSHEKIFSNGIDLEWLVPLIQKGDTETAKSFFYAINRLFKRVLLYPMPTVCAVSGHAFAGGAILTCAFDFRLMRSDRGFFCLPEVDLGIPFLPGMIALLSKAIPSYKLEELQYTGKRATAQELEAHHIVIKACHGDDLMDEALSFAQGLKKRREVISEMKKRMYGRIVQVLEAEDPPIIESGRFHF